MSLRADITYFLLALALLVFVQCATQPPPPQPSPSPTVQPSPTPTPCSVPPSSDPRWHPVDGQGTLGPIIVALQKVTQPVSDDAMVATLLERGYCAGRFDDGIVVQREDGIFEEHRPTASFGGWRSKTFCTACSLWVLGQ
jgi:hypothetical protein